MIVELVLNLLVMSKGTGAISITTFCVGVDVHMVRLMLLVEQSIDAKYTEVRLLFKT